MRTQSYEIRIQESFHAARHTGYQYTLTVSVHRLPTYFVGISTQAAGKIEPPDHFEGICAQTTNNIEQSDWLPMHRYTKN